MADDQITQMVNDSDFGKLSPAEQRKALAAHDPIFNKASDEVIAQFILAHHATRGITTSGVSKFEGTDIPKSPSRIPASMTGHPEEGLTQQDVRETLPAAGATIASLLAGPEAGLAVRTLAATAGATTGSAAKQELGSGQITPGQTAIDATLNGLIPELGGAGTAKIAEKLIPAAGKALARNLRLSPRAFEFGREPAQEVLERGLGSGSLPEIKASIGEASKQVTSDLNAALQGTKGAVNVESHAIDVANNMPGNSGGRFLKLVDDAAEKLGIRTNQLSSLSPSEVNALKQEVARQSKFVEGDVRPSVANAGKVFGGRLKDELIKLNPEVAPLLESSANLTEASKGADYAVRAEKAGQGKGLLGGVQINKPGTYARAVTDRPGAPQLLYNIVNSLKDHTPVSNALRIGFQLVYGDTEGGQNP